MTEEHRAARVILEIIRQSAGDAIEGKTRLFKAFYFAHLFYAIENSSCLTEWPIVRMPHGPGIDRFDDLLENLKSNGLVEAVECHVGPYTSTKFQATKTGLLEESMPDTAAHSVTRAIEFVAHKTGAQLSDITHEFSNSWNDAEDGDELPIYLDLLDDHDYQRAKQKASVVEHDLRVAWG